METSDSYSKFAAGAAPEVRQTAGTLLPNGVVLDLVREQSELKLLVCNAEKVTTESYFEYDGIHYVPPKLHGTILNALIFPRAIREYGSDAAFFRRIADAFRDYCGLPVADALGAAVWVRATWIRELLAVPPTLCVVAWSLRQALPFLQLARVLSARAIAVAKLDSKLPFSVGPTLLINDRRLTTRAGDFWHAANVPGVYVAGRGGILQQIACSRAILLRPEDALDSWAGSALRIVLPPIESPPLSNDVLKQLPDEFQPQLELWRLRMLSAKDRAISPYAGLANCEIARPVAVCMPEDAEIAEALTPWFRSQQEEILERRQLDVQVVIIEVLWEPAHREGEISPTEIANRVNALLRSRGEFLEYNSRELGWRLERLRLRRQRGRNGRVVKFSSEIRRRMHELARQFGLQLPAIQGCPDCVQATDSEAVL